MENELILFETADKEIKLTVPIKNKICIRNDVVKSEFGGTMK